MDEVDTFIRWLARLVAPLVGVLLACGLGAVWAEAGVPSDAANILACITVNGLMGLLIAAMFAVTWWGWRRG